MNANTKTEYKGYLIEIGYDEEPESPRDWGNEDVFLVYSHRQFTVEEDGFEPREIFDFLNYPSKPVEKDYGFVESTGFDSEPSGWVLEEGEEKFNEALEEWENNKGTDYSDYFIFTVNAYIHSGVSLSLSNDKYPFNDRFDVSTTGFVLVEKEEYNEESAKNIAEGLIETWNTYLSGQVLYYKIYKQTKTYSITEEELNALKEGEDKESEDSYIFISQFIAAAIENTALEQKDSCYGFYDTEENVLIEAKSVIDTYE